MYVSDRSPHVIVSRCMVYVLELVCHVEWDRVDFLSICSHDGNEI